MKKHTEINQNISSEEGFQSLCVNDGAVMSKPSSEPLPKHKSKHFTISQPYIKTLLSRQQKGAFALYLMMKGVFSDTKFLNFSVSKHHKMIGVSAYILRKYYPIMIKMGLAKWEGKHLVLTAFKKVTPEKTGNLMLIPNNLSFQQTVEEIEFCNIKEDYRQQMFMADMASGRNIARRNMRSYKKLYAKYGKKSLGNDKTITSFRRIARLCKVSESTAHRKVRKWVSQERMKIATSIEVIKHGYSMSYTPVMTEQGLLCVSKGDLVLVQGSTFAVRD